MQDKQTISDKLLAAYLDGNTTDAESQEVPEAVQTDFNTTQSILPPPHPMLQKAALSGENVCAVLCELFILHRRHLPYDEQSLFDIARQKDWLKAEGTPLYCLGNLLAYSGLLVSRKYNATPEDIHRAISHDNDVVVGVDREKLYGEDNDLEDLTNHAVVVTYIDKEYVTVFDPYDSSYVSRISIKQFLTAWQQSHYYMIQILQSIDEYDPNPINVDDVPLDGDLEELHEAIAEYAHDVWARARISEGWTYGPVRDDALKRHPDLMPYSSLPETEKEYDRLMAINTIKLVKMLGFDICKKLS